MARCTFVFSILIYTLQLIVSVLFEKTQHSTAQHSWPELATSEVACVTHGKDCGDRSLETTANVASNELLTFYERLSVTCVGR